MAMFRAERQFLQRRERWVALEERVEAPMTMPGMRTNLEIVLACLSAIVSDGGRYVQVSDGGCVFGRVERHLAIGDGLPSWAFGGDFTRNKENLLERILLDGVFKLNIS
jgi:hypothetical protein